MQSMLLPLMLKAVLVLLTALIVLYLQRDAAAARRHRHLAAALIALLTLPLLETLPEIDLAILPHTSESGLLLPNQLPTLLLELYLFGVVAGALMLINRHISMRALLRRSKPVDNVLTSRILAQHGLSRVRICQSRDINGPISYGLLRSHIILPERFLTHSNEIIDAAINHELAHIRRRDCLMQLLADIVLVLNWCNPLAWLCIHQLREQAEFSSDDDVLELGGNQHRYAEALVSYARIAKRGLQTDSENTALQPAYAWLNANLKSRIHALLQQRRRERSDNAKLVETSLLYLFLLLPLSVVHAVPQPAPYKDFMQQEPPGAVDDAYTDYIIVAPTTDQRNQRISCFTKPLQPAPSREHRFTRNPAQALVAKLPPPEDMSTISSLQRPQLARTLNAHVSIHGEMPLRSVIPAYPKKAQRRGIEGYVVVAFDIKSDGRVENARVSDANPAGVFDRSALEAIQQSQFKPLRFASRTVGIRNASTRFIYQLGDPTPVLPANNKPYPFNGPTLIASAQQGE
jgi:TonB family protein